MLDKFKEILKHEDVLKADTPSHIAITLSGVAAWAEKNKVPLEDAYKKSGNVIYEIIKEQLKASIPAVTFYLLPESMDKSSEQFLRLLDSIVLFFDETVNNQLITENKIKISVIGKWYDLPGRVVDSIKKVIDATKEHNSFFVNFCVNYSGQEEIVDACRLIARQVKAGKRDPDSIDKSMIKENLYSSYFLPPDLLIANGYRKRTRGILLWDSGYATIYVSGKLWPDFSRADFLEAVKRYKK